jgi:hypothetical protein
MSAYIHSTIRNEIKRAHIAYWQDNSTKLTAIADEITTHIMAHYTALESQFETIENAIVAIVDSYVSHNGGNNDQQ